VFSNPNFTTNLGFFGIIADESITRIEIEEANQGGELLAFLQFGACANLSIDDILNQQLSIYPNPAKNNLTIDNTSSLQISDAKLYNIIGKDTGIRLEGDNLNIASLPAGIYFLTLTTSEGSTTRKIIKE